MGTSPDSVTAPACIIPDAETKLLLQGMSPLFRLGHTAALAECAFLLAALTEAERFIAGFEGDAMQDGIDVTLAAIRAAIAKATGA